MTLAPFPTFALLSLALVSAAGAETIAPEAITPAQTTPYTVFQGTLFIVGVTSQCATNAAATIGEQYTVVYRPKMVSSDPDEALTLTFGRGAGIYYPTDGGGKFNASTKLTANIILPRATYTTWSTTHTIRIQPTTVTTSTNFVQITGTLSNWNANGCLITVRGSGARRP